MPWDDSDDDFFDGFTDGMMFSSTGFWATVVIILIVALILYLT